MTEDEEGENGDFGPPIQRICKVLLCLNEAVPDHLGDESRPR